MYGVTRRLSNDPPTRVFEELLDLSLSQGTAILDAQSFGKLGIFHNSAISAITAAKIFTLAKIITMAMLTQSHGLGHKVARSQPTAMKTCQIFGTSRRWTAVHVVNRLWPGLCHPNLFPA